MHRDGAPHAGRLPLAEVRRRIAELEAKQMARKSELRARIYTAVPIATPGDDEMLVVLDDGRIESIPYSYDGVKSVSAGVKEVEDRTQREVVHLICNSQVREDWKRHLGD